MSLREQANRAALAALDAAGGDEALLGLAERLGARTIDGLFGLIHQKIDWKHERPCAAAAFHNAMVRGIRRRRWYPFKWLSMYHHKRLRARWEAMCSVVS